MPYRSAFDAGRLRPAPTNRILRSSRSSGFPVLFLAAALGLVALLLPDIAIAQYGGPGYGFGPPSTAALFGSRLTTIVIAAVLGFIAGAFFSPLLKTFRKYLLLGLLALAVLFALFGPYLIADALSSWWRSSAAWSLLGLASGSA